MGVNGGQIPSPVAIPKRLLTYDRSTLFSEQFRQMLRSGQVEGLRLPARSPNLNAFAE